MPPSSRSAALDRPALLALIVGLGLALSGWFIGYGFLRGRSADRYVEVKGLAEREVTAGVFVILPRDQAPGVNESGQLQKVVRVVATVQYFLK